MVASMRREPITAAARAYACVNVGTYKHSLAININFICEPLFEPLACFIGYIQISKPTHSGVNNFGKQVPGHKVKVKLSKRKNHFVEVILVDNQIRPFDILHS